jgi:hypothetical protein
MSSQGARVTIFPSYVPYPNGFFDRKTSGLDLSGPTYLFSEGSPVRTNKELGRLSKDELLLFNQIQPKADMEIIKCWLNNCSEVHGSRCRNIDNHSVNMRLRLIDCMQRMVVDAGAGANYVALSYVWGKTSISTTKTFATASSGLMFQIPATIEDSIVVCLELGFRYLWVDKMCIPQDDEEERRRQINQMDAIYGGASLTIIAGAGGNPSYGLPGISRQRLRFPCIPFGYDRFLAALPTLHDLRGSPWASRAW